MLIWFFFLSNYHAWIIEYVHYVIFIKLRWRVECVHDVIFIELWKIESSYQEHDESKNRESCPLNWRRQRQTRQQNKWTQQSIRPNSTKPIYGILVFISSVYYLRRQTRKTGLTKKKRLGKLMEVILWFVVDVWVWA